ncbi:hypothetical protein ACJJTC_018046 [Scirpophaga incertulas]
MDYYWAENDDIFTILRTVFTAISDPSECGCFDVRYTGVTLVYPDDTFLVIVYITLMAKEHAQDRFMPEMGVTTRRAEFTQGPRNGSKWHPSLSACICILMFYYIRTMGSRDHITFTLLAVQLFREW